MTFSAPALPLSAIRRSLSGRAAAREISAMARKAPPTMIRASNSRLWLTLMGHSGNRDNAGRVACCGAAGLCAAADWPAGRHRWGVADCRFRNNTQAKPRPGSGAADPDEDVALGFQSARIV